MAAASTSADLQFVRHAYKAAVMARDSHRARSIVLDALEQGADPFSLDLDVLQPVLVELGERWVEGDVSVAHEHFVTGVTEGVMALLAGRMRKAPANGRLAVVACPPGERHSLGARMLSDFLEADAWEVICLGADTPARDLLALVEDEQPDVVALSVTMPSCVDAAVELLGALGTADPRPLLAVGGRGWPEGVAAADAGADVVARDARQLLDLLRERLPEPGDDE
ncbi:MAG TPA: cobalamin-dependent protein [Solirubrobacteraceae bacterium]|nr:cobalamin-dependent protein [Solirubrobacteraceae bacterium]